MLVMDGVGRVLEGQNPNEIPVSRLTFKSRHVGNHACTKKLKCKTFGLNTKGIVQSELRSIKRTKNSHQGITW